VATRQPPVAAAPLAPPPTPAIRRLDWLDPIKAFALVAILLNHLVEEFGHGPWFTNPGGDWPASLATRLHTFLPSGPSPLWNALRFLGWLGDNGPGVFIVASGIGLTLAALRLPPAERDGPVFRSAFYRRRLLRLYPLYIAMHVVILGLAVIVPVTLTFASPATLLSLAGLRITPGLFFYISPAWWFVWLILQLYAVYPWLLRALDKLHAGRFLAAALTFTILSRAIGLVAPAGIRYDWLTGMFFGCRLAEFATGMVIAQWLAQGRPIPSAGRVGVAGALVYAAGLAASLTLVGALVSNWLVAIGLTALFYAAWRAMPIRPIAALGAVSYSVFLLHQPPLKWTAILFAGHPAAHAVAAVLVLAASIPAGAWIERTVERLRTTLPQHLIRLAAPLSWVSGFAIVGALAGLEPQLAPDGHWHRALAFVIALATGALAWLEWLDHDAPRGRALARRIGLLAGALGLFVMPAGSGYIAAVFGIVAAIAVTATGSWVAGGIATVVFLAVAEIVAGRVAPREVGGWGERPALQIHPTRAFGLIPDRVTRLRYNDYDYVIRTNSFGLASPDIAVARPTPTTLRVLTVGDAFTMPEGLPYEQSYPALLQAALARCLAPRPVQVINAGVTGYGPLEELPQVRELDHQFAPDIIVHEFFVNDWSDITIGTDDRRRGIGFTGHGGIHGLLHDRSHLIANLRRWYESSVAAVTGQPSPDQRWKLMLDYFRRGDNALYDSANVARMTTFLAAMRDEARADRATLLSFYVPAGVAVLPRQDIVYLPRSGIPISDTVDFDLRRPYTPLAHIADSLGVTLVDLTGPLKTHTPQPVYYRNAWHWTPEGHRAAADAIVATMRERGLIPAGCTP